MPRSNGILDAHGVNRKQTLASILFALVCLPYTAAQDACVVEEVTINTGSWAAYDDMSWDIRDLDGTIACSGSGYYDSSISVSESCCLAEGSYTLTCHDSYGDGWKNGGFLQIGDEQYCGWTSGSWHQESVDFQITAPQASSSSAPSQPPAVPCDINMVTVRTHKWAHEISWEIADSDGHTACSGGNYVGHEILDYQEQCCLHFGSSYTVQCYDSYGDGWNGGSLSIYGEEYCTSMYSPDGSFMAHALDLVEQPVPAYDTPCPTTCNHWYEDANCDDLMTLYAIYAAYYEDAMTCDTLESMWGCDCTGCTSCDDNPTNETWAYDTGSGMYDPTPTPTPTVSPTPTPTPTYDMGSGEGLAGAAAATCSNVCYYALNNVCDDGGNGATYSDCSLGTDCDDCGPRPATTVLDGLMSASSDLPSRRDERAAITPAGLTPGQKLAALALVVGVVRRFVDGNSAGEPELPTPSPPACDDDICDPFPPSASPPLDSLCDDDICAPIPPRVPPSQCDDDICDPLPPPAVVPHPSLPPVPQAFTAGVSITMTAAGDVSDYDADKKATLEANMATTLGVAASAVSLTVTAGSVTLLFTVQATSADDAAAIAATAGSVLSTVDAATSALGGAGIGLVIESAPAVTNNFQPATLPPSTPSSPPMELQSNQEDDADADGGGGSSNATVAWIVIATLVAVGLIVGGVVYFCRAHLAKGTDTRDVKLESAETGTAKKNEAKK